jgi:methylenetetrahydrofolate reductase (NADPH)
MNPFQAALSSKREFVVTCEHVPGRGYSGAAIDNIMKFADQAKDSPAIHALSITDNAGGNPAMLADELGREVLAIGLEPLIHFTSKDTNRNMIESRAYALKRAGIDNVLVITGDYPIAGEYGLAKPVFDIDSTLTLHYLKSMNAGLSITHLGKSRILEPTSFYLGAVASPFKATEASQVMQYKKMEKKIRAGADYIATQLGYDSRKYAEFIAYVRKILGSDIPLLGSVYILSAGAGRYMNSGEVPGCYVDDRLVGVLQEEAKAEDKGKGGRLERAAKQIAILKGLGYDGAHLEGLNLKYADVQQVLQRSDELAGNWKDYVEEFDFMPENTYFYFEGGGDFAFVKNGKDPVPVKTKRRCVCSLTFWMMRFAHRLFFVENTLGYRFMRALSRGLDKRRGGMYKFFSFMEAAGKKMLFDCRECDDCALPELFYLCPESQCPKGQRIGPCGGGRINGNCEVHEERPCIWERVHRRAKNRRELDKLDYIITPRDWQLYETSSWVNYYLKYDHTGKELKTTEKKEQT